MISTAIADRWLSKSIGWLKLGSWLLAIFMLTGCDGETGSRPKPHHQAAIEAEPNSRVFGAAFQTLENPFFVDLNEGIREVVEANGDELISLGCGWDHSEQVQQIDELLAQPISALFLNPVDRQRLQSTLLRARDEGIPCIVVDTQVEDDSLVVCQVVSDNVEAGRLAGRSLARKLAAIGNKSAEIAILNIPANRACIDRVAGFQEVIDNHANMETIAIEDGKGTSEGSRPAMQRLLEQHTDLEAVFAVNEPIAPARLRRSSPRGNLTRSPSSVSMAREKGLLRSRLASCSRRPCNFLVRSVASRHNGPMTTKMEIRSIAVSRFLWNW